MGDVPEMVERVVSEIKSADGILLVNLETGETMHADAYALAGRGLPDGYRVACGILTEEWIEALRAALASQGNGRER